MPKFRAHGGYLLMLCVRYCPVEIMGFLPFHHPFSRLRLCVGGLLKPGTWPPSGRMLSSCITSICRSMKSRANVLVRFVYTIISWSIKWFSPSTKSQTTKFVCWRPSKTRTLATFGILNRWLYSKWLISRATLKLTYIRLYFPNRASNYAPVFIVHIYVL